MFKSINFNPKKESVHFSDCTFDHGLAKTLQAEVAQSATPREAGGRGSMNPRF